MAGTGRDQYTQTAESVPFDNTDTNYTADNVSDALKQVSDIVEGSFNFSNATSFEVFNNDTTNSTTSTTFQTQLLGTTVALIPGDFVINWSFEITNSGNNNISLARVQWKKNLDASWITLADLNLFIGRTEIFIPISGFRVVVLDSSDAIDIRVQYAAGDATVRIRNTSAYIFKVAPE